MVHVYIIYQLYEKLVILFFYRYSFLCANYDSQRELLAVGILIITPLTNTAGRQSIRVKRLIRIGISLILRLTVGVQNKIIKIPKK